jgi:hypothetical protein
MSEIYNKNAREKALLEEAYTGVYEEAAVDVQLDSWWEYDPHDVVVKVYHGALHAIPPQQGTPEYEKNFETIFTWLEGKYPQHSEEVDTKKSPRQRHLDDEFEDAEMEFDERGFAKNTEAGYEREDTGPITVGQIYRGTEYDEIVVGIQGDEIWTRKLDSDTHVNRYDKNQMLDEVELIDPGYTEDNEDNGDNGDAGAQEYDMDRDPQGRREADPREW